jgi:hypothetical protein
MASSKTPGETVHRALLELANYHRGAAGSPKGFQSPQPKLKGSLLTKAWTSAEIGFIRRRLEQEGFAVQGERAASLRLPPDLVVRDAAGKLSLHVERETRGWEWNHVIGALVKVLIVNKTPAPMAAVLLANVWGDAAERIDLILRLATALLRSSPAVKQLYLALWLGKEYVDARVFSLRMPRKRPGEVVVEQVVPPRQARIRSGLTKSRTKSRRL